MPSDWLQPDASEPGGLTDQVTQPQPNDADVVSALVGIEKASAPHAITVPPATASWFASNGVVIIFLAGVMVVSVLLAWGVKVAGRKIFASLATQSQHRISRRAASRVDATTQAEAEGILMRVAAGDSGASEQVFSVASGWTGRTARTPKAEQSITAALNSHDVRAREAAIRAVLALDGITADEAGLEMLKEAVGNPSQRAWALWNLGALGNRGVDPMHTAKIIEAYMSDPDVNTRANAVNGLSLVGTDETVPMLLDRFRNDPSPAVQERAACALAESGMYVHKQRLVAAASFVAWLDDSLMTAPQRMWALHALRDISGQDHGNDSAAWRQWYEGTH